MTIEKKKKKLRQAWKDMRRRCYNTNHPKYAEWGGRGITVCAEWLESRDAFIAWGLANGCDEGLTLDRADNNGNYCPENCRWITRAEQIHNQRMLKTNTSGISGVSWNKRAKKWRAYIAVARKQYHLGLFECKLEAAAARDLHIIENELPHKLSDPTLHLELRA